MIARQDQANLAPKRGLSMFLIRDEQIHNRQVPCPGQLGLDGRCSVPAVIVLSRFVPAITAA
jgi:hypothetical protein